MQQLRREMDQYYSTIRSANAAENREFCQRIADIEAAMEAFVAANPSVPACLVKSRLHQEMAQQFDPVIFTHSPFFYEMGLRYAENWGVANGYHAGGLLYCRNLNEVRQRPATSKIDYFGSKSWQLQQTPLGLWFLYPFDRDHHCLGITKLLKVGINGILQEIEDRQAQGGDEDQLAFLQAAQESCNALLLIAERFAHKANEMLADADDPQAREFLQMIAKTATRIPANSPETFYEGLAAIWFLREVAGTMEGIGISVIGHIDRLLIDLYRNDLQAGRITESQARDLLARWLLPTDIKFHVDDNQWPETSTCIELGGCDENGTPVFNELTRMILEVHGEHGLLNPKLNCRYSASSDQEYLDLMSEQILAGKNNYALLNDDVLIPACVKTGKTEAEARLYVNGGCQETMVEGVEHSAGAYYYFNIARLFDLCMNPPVFTDEHTHREDLDACIPPVITDADSFEDFYQTFITRLDEAISMGAEWARQAGHNWDEINPCPLFSASITGCIDNAKDYSGGGAKYNPAGIALVGLGTLVDSLHAIKTAVYQQKRCNLPELRNILANDWDNHEALRNYMASLPKYGHGESEVDQLAARLCRDLHGIVSKLTNERGGPFQASFFVYYTFMRMAFDVGATPDGRRAGDLLSQGIGPSRLRPPQSITQAFRSIESIDFTLFPGNSVLDVQLPAVGSLKPQTLSAALRTFAQMGGATIQCNCVSVDKLRDAQKHPEKHQDLIVRISGLSAKFVCLQEDVQDEIIDRMMLAT